MATSSLSRASFRSAQVTEDFKVGAGAAPNAQGDLLVGNGAGGLVVKPLPPATPAASVLVAGPAAAPPSTRIDWAPLTIEDAAGASPGAVSLVTGVSAASGGLAALGVRKVVGGTGIATAASGGDLVVNADFTVGSAGGGLPLVAVSSAPGAPVLRTLVAGSGTDIAESGDLLTFSASAAGGGADTTLASAGGTETLVVDGVGPDLTVKGLTAGAGIALTSDATSITVSDAPTLPPITLASAGVTGTSLVNDGVGPALVIKGLSSGTSVGLTATAAAVTVSATFGVNSDGGGLSLVSSTSAAGAPVLKTMAAGVGIDIDTTAGGGNRLTFNSTTPAANTYLEPRRALHYNGTFVTSLAAGSAVGTINMSSATTWYPLTLYTLTSNYVYTTAADGTFTVVSGVSGATPAILLLYYHIVARADSLSGGLMAGIYRETPTLTLLPQTVTQGDRTPATNNIIALRCMLFVSGVLNGESYRLYVRSLGGTDSAVEFYSCVFGAVQIYPNV